MSGLTKEQLHRFKRMLNQRQNELIAQLKNRYGLEVSQTDAIGELSSYDNHPADLGTELFERSKDVALREHKERELEEINKALHAIHEGTYGICKVCSMNIPYERLVSNPTADMCIEHAENDAANNDDRPVEEEIMNPSFKDLDTAINEESFYDREDAWQDVSRYGSSNTASDLYGDHASYNEMYENSGERIGSVDDIELYSDE